MVHRKRERGSERYPKHRKHDLCPPGQYISSRRGVVGREYQLESLSDEEGYGEDSTSSKGP